MNAQKPRWICRVLRGARALAGSDATHGMADAHFATCSDCQQYFSGLDRLARDLKEAARVAQQPAPAGFDSRVLAALRQKQPERRVRQRRFSQAAFAVAGVAAAVALVVIPLRRTARVNRTIPQGSSATVGVEVAQAIDSLPNLTASVRTALQQQPLQEEIDSMSADARSAVDFLALNFLPDGAPESAKGRTPTAGG